MAFTMNPPELPQLGNQPVVLAIAMFSTGPAKQPLFLRWSRTKTMGYGLVRLVCLVRKSHVGALKRSILREKNLLLAVFILKKVSKRGKG